MKTATLLFFTLLLFSCSGRQDADNLAQSSTTVYICTGKHAKVYHADKDCKGLRKCKGDIEKVSIKEAKDDGRRACKICY